MRLHSRLRVAGMALTLLAAAIGGAGNAAAEGKIRIAEQFGITCLPLHVIRDRGLIEKYGKALGVDIGVDWARLSGGASINDALLSGSIDIGAAGIGPVLTLWDRTKGNADVKGIAALGSLPYLLVGTRLHLLSPHPGRTLATFDTGHLTFADLGSQRFETVARTVHDLLFAREAADA